MVARLVGNGLPAAREAGGAGIALYTELGDALDEVRKHLEPVTGNGVRVMRKIRTTRCRDSSLITHHSITSMHDDINPRIDGNTPVIVQGISGRAGRCTAS